MRSGPARGDRRLRSGQTHLVVVVEQAQCSRAVLVPVDAHHRLGRRGEGVLQEGLPGFVLTRVGAPLRVECFILKNQHRPFASGKTRILRLGFPAARHHKLIFKAPIHDVATKLPIVSPRAL